MRVSKHLHSCILVEESGKTALIDPGIFTSEEKALDIEKLQNLNYILITHEHKDHMHIPFIKELLSKFPDAKIISNKSVVEILTAESIKAQNNGDEFVSLKEITHEHIFDNPSPPNSIFEVFGRLTHPGDYISFDRSADVLALPLLGPSWMITQAAEKAIEVKPKTIIPIHDHHLRNNYREEYYKRLDKFFAEKNIKFLSTKTGEVFEI